MPLNPIADVVVFCVEIYGLAKQVAVATPLSRFPVGSPAVLKLIVVLAESAYQAVG